MQVVKEVDEGADVPKDHPESLFHLRPPAVGVVKGSPGLSGLGFDSPVGQLNPVGGAVVVGLVLVGKPVQTHWNKVFEIHLIEPTNVFGLKTLSGKELEPVVSLLLSLDRHTITISWGKLFEADNFPSFLYDCPSSVVASSPFTYLE